MTVPAAALELEKEQDMGLVWHDRTGAEQEGCGEELGLGWAGPGSSGQLREARQNGIATLGELRLSEFVSSLKLKLIGNSLS